MSVYKKGEFTAVEEQFLDKAEIAYGEQVAAATACLMAGEGKELFARYASAYEPELKTLAASIGLNVDLTI